jgi:hypothetical protein
MWFLLVASLIAAPKSIFGRDSALGYDKEVVIKASKDASAE